MKFLHFLRYDNAVPIALGIVFLGASGAFAATNPEAVFSSNETVISEDNTYIAHKDLSNYTPQILITSVTEDDTKYYVAYAFSTIDVQDYTWQDVIKTDSLVVDKTLLGEQHDLGLYATKQFSQLIDHEIERLRETKNTEQRKVSVKVVATKYGGLVGKFLDEKTEELPGYVPVVTPPEPDLSQNSPVIPQVAGASVVVGTADISMTRDEIERMIQEQIRAALAANANSQSSQGGGTTSAPEPAPEPPAESPPEPNPEDAPPAESPASEPQEEPTEPPTEMEPEPIPTLDPAPIPEPAPEPEPQPELEPIATP